VSNLSPWLWGVKPGDIHTIPVSHGEGRFVADKDKIDELISNGQVATQYVDNNKNATYNIKYNVAIREYIGDATLTIVDTLPYKIDEKASNLNEGIYNDENQTITWTIDLENINTLENGKNRKFG